MLAVAMLDASRLTVFDIVDLLSFKVATFLPSLVKLGQEIKEQHQFFSASEMAATAMLDSGHPVFFIAYMCC